MAKLNEDQQIVLNGLKEYDPITQLFSGEAIEVEISYMPDFPLKDDYVVLGIEEIWEG